jgi:outer membrane protein assembly factor BamB
LAPRFSVLLLSLLAAACSDGSPPPEETQVLPARKKWVAALPTGEDIAGPLATDGTRLFVGTNRSVRALDRVLGTGAWGRTDVSGTLSVAPGVLVVRNAAGVVVALDPASGKTRWTAATGSAGTQEAAIEGARIYVIGSRYTVLDTASGKVVVDLALDSPATTRPVRSGPCLLAGHADSSLRCLDAETGRTIWSFPMARPLEAPPTVDGDMILVGTGTSDRRALALKRSGKTDWTFKLGAGVSVAPAAGGRYVLLANTEAVLYAFLRRNGHMAWRAPLPSRPLGPPIVVGKQVLVASLPDELLAFHLDTGKAAGTTRIGIERLGVEARPSEIRTPPLMVERMIYVGIRGPWAVVALEPGAAPKPPEALPPFPPDPAEDVARPTPIP